MKFIFIAIMTIAIVTVLFTVVSKQTLKGYKQVQLQQGAAQAVTDAYRKSQEDMMKQLGQ